MVNDTGPLGLGRPRGPDFLPATLTPPAQPLPARGMPGPGTAPAPVPGKGRLLMVAALVAAVVGGGAGVAGARLTGGSEPAPAALPRSTAGPVAQPGSLSAIAAQVLPSVVSIEADGATGSGFVIDTTGHILTNAHVVAGRTDATVVCGPAWSAPTRPTTSRSSRWTAGRA
jgi:putative serine protease PepD